MFKKVLKLLYQQWRVIQGNNLYYFFISNFYYIRNIYYDKTNVCMVGINWTS